MAEFNFDDLLARFQERAAAVRERGIPPLEGEARRAYVAQMETDFTDYSLVGSAEWAVEGDHVVLRIPLGG